MGRLILITLAVLILVWLLRRALGSRSGGGEVREAGKLQGELVSCAHCGMHLPRAEARTAGGHYFCSEEHWRLGPKDSSKDS